MEFRVDPSASRNRYSICRLSRSFWQCTVAETYSHRKNIEIHLLNILSLEGWLPTRSDEICAHFSEWSCSPWFLKIFRIIRVMGYSSRCVELARRFEDRWSLSCHAAEYLKAILPWVLFAGPVFRHRGYVGLLSPRWSCRSRYVATPIWTGLEVL